MFATTTKIASGTVLLLVSLFLSSRCAYGDGEAYPGRPFGIGRVGISLRGSEAMLARETGGFALSERDGRALYPVFTEGRIARFLGGILGGDPSAVPANFEVLFLFAGDGPLNLTVYTPDAQRVALTPQLAPNPRASSRLLMRWWREYNATARELVQQGDYPPLVQTYLTSMLSRRLGLEPPLLSRIVEKPPEEPAKTFQLLMGVESLRMATMRRNSLGQVPADEVADIPAPREIEWTPLDAPPPDPQVEIEPIAMHVPQECFYIRFGSFNNYFWVDRLLNEYGGDISQMITLRGYDAGLSKRMQQQLVLRQSALAEVMGPTVVADMALIGRDLYLREGPAIGLLFKARTPLFSVDINGQRAEALEREKENGATLETEKIAGRDVSFLSTPDNRLRSFYVADGDYHLVTTSRTIMKRFLEVSQNNGSGSVGASQDFRHARTVMPTSRDDTIFIYLSSAFFQGLISPQYQTELNRRLRAVTEMELLQMAKWAARAENKSADTIEDLVRGNLLPDGFGRRADGSAPMMSNGRMIDSVRGARGSFMPIPDVPLRFVTRSEAAKLAEQATYYSDQWRQMDPLMMGIRRYAMEGERMERIVIDAHVSPFGQEKYGWIMSLLGPPTPVRISPAPGDIITAQASVKGGLLSPQVPPHHLFLGVQDSVPLTDLQATGFLKTLKILQTTPGYLGAWPKPGFLDWLPLRLGGGPPDAFGYSRLPFGVWRRQWDVFSALSFDPELLAHVTPHLVPEEAENDAQIRIYVGDLSTAQLRAWVNALTYARAHQASLGNAKLLHAFSQQLVVPREDALSEAEQLLDAKLVCTVGGEYQLDQKPGSAGLWKSSHWPDPQTGRTPNEYSARLLEWFRGMDVELTNYGDQMVLHTVVDMQRKPTEKKKVELPFFNFNLFGGSKKTGPRKSLPEPPAEEIEAPPKGAKVQP